MSEVRQRKPQSTEAEDTKAAPAPPVAKSGGSSRLGLLLGLGALSLAAVGLLYKDDVSSALNLSGSSSGELILSEKQLRAYTGADPSKPIYLAIDGVIYDVSASPRFYGPGGHYNHFTGRDASRGWVTECWDTPDQLVHNMDGVEAMFMPRYMDEELQRAAAGEEIDEYVKERQGLGPLIPRAKEIIELVGEVDQEELERRRAEDVPAAKQKVRERLDHWIGFFSGNEKYKIAGKVKLSPGDPNPPVPCNAAMMKKPMKPGKIEAAGAALMQQLAEKAGMTPEQLAEQAAEAAKKQKAT